VSKAVTGGTAVPVSECSWRSSKKKRYNSPVTGPEGCRTLRFPDFVTTAQDSGRLSALRTGRLYPQEMLVVLISVIG